MDWTLELIVVPVSDVDRAKAFYVDQLGFGLEVDMTTGPDFRVVQLTPPGSACSIAIGIGIGEMEPGTLHGLHLCVDDIEAAHRQLVERGVDVSEPFHFGEAGQATGLDPGAPQLLDVRDLPRPRRQHLARPGSEARLGPEAGQARRGRRVTRGGRCRARRWGVRVRGPHRAIPARAPRPLLPDARLVRRGRGRGPGDVPAGVARRATRSTAARWSGRGCTRSRPTSVSTRCDGPPAG